MKNRRLFILIPLMLLMSLTSCIFNVNHQYCFFIEGNFISKDNNYYFDVKEITKDEYDSENNINVIADKVLKYKQQIMTYL